MANNPTLEEIGSRYATPKLLSQTDYFVELAAKDAEDLKTFGWSAKRSDELRGRRTKTAEMFADKALAKEDTVAATESRDRIVGAAKLWIRRLIAAASNAFDLDSEKLDDFRIRETLGRSIARVQTRVETLLRTAKANAPALAEWGVTEAFWKEGQQVASALKDAEAGQKLKVGDLPKKTQEFYRLKGDLYLSVKRLQRVGRAAYAHDPVRAARYNLDLLYRQAPERKPAPAAKA